MVTKPQTDRAVVEEGGPALMAAPSKGWLGQVRILVAGALIIAAGLGAYHNSFRGPFIFDDIESIPENPTIQQLWPIGDVLEPPNDGQAVQRRPIVNLSLAINYSLGGLEPVGYHVFNLGVHILAGLVLFGIVRRTLILPQIQQRLGGSSMGLSLAIALIWMVHPLASEAVTYVIQRTELLAGLFYLLSLYCVIRSADSGRAVWWYAGATVSCGLGMGSKEVVVSAPVIILLYDRIFLCGSFKQVFRQRWILYAGLGAGWLILAGLIPRGQEGAVIFGQGTTSLDYALTQFESISRYVRLSFWPRPLILDYGYFEASSFRQALPHAMLVVFLLGATVWAVRYRPGMGFLGVCFFFILGPSSSFVPLLRQATAEKRMYLPLAVVIVAVVVGVYSVGRYALRRWAGSSGLARRWGIALGWTLAGIVIVELGWLTVLRNYDYRTEFAIWDDTVAKRPDNYRAHTSRGVAHFKEGRRELAIRDFERAIELNPEYPLAYNSRGFAHKEAGKYKLAIRDFSKAIELRPGFVQAYVNRGRTYNKMGKQKLAKQDFEMAMALNPRCRLEEMQKDI